VYRTVYKSLFTFYAQNSDDYIFQIRKQVQRERGQDLTTTKRQSWDSDPDPDSRAHVSSPVSTLTAASTFPVMGSVWRPLQIQLNRSRGWDP
jgi:hypothetical protein